MAYWTGEMTEEILQFIKDYAREHGYPPTIREIAQFCHTSRTNVLRYLDRLEKWRRIQREPGIPRGITILDKD